MCRVNYSVIRQGVATSGARSCADDFSMDGMSGVDAAHVANRFAAASLDHRGMEGLVERLTDVPFDIFGDSFLNSATEVEL